MTRKGCGREVLDGEGTELTARRGIGVVLRS